MTKIVPVPLRSFGRTRKHGRPRKHRGLQKAFPMNNRIRASVAQIVARLVSRRTTRADEIPELIQTVALALARLTRRPEPEMKIVAAPAPPPQTRLRAPRLPRVSA